MVRSIHPVFHGIHLSNHPIVPAIHRHLRSRRLPEERAGHGRDHVADVAGFDLGLEQVAGLVFLDRHVVTLGGTLEVLGRPEFRVEDGVGVDDVAAHAEGRELTLNSLINYYFSDGIPSVVNLQFAWDGQKANEDRLKSLNITQRAFGGNMLDYDEAWK